MLILADQDAWFPGELLHDGQMFLGDRFIIGRWLWELDKARPYEFPVGAVNVAHYASVEQPEVWTDLEDLQVFIVTSGLQVTPADSVEMRRTPTGDYLGCFSLSVPQQMESQFVLVQVFFEDGMEPVHSLRFQVKVGNQNGERR